MATQEEIANAIKLLNENNYIAIPVSKGQMYLCDNCRENDNDCRYSTLGYTCSNLLCINDAIKTQLDMSDIHPNPVEE